MIPAARSIESIAPVRIADCGGWTDTWFARRGAVCSIAIAPCVHVRIDTMPRGDAAETISISAANFGAEYAYAPGAEPGILPLVESAIGLAGITRETALRIRIASEMPPGASTGTSAAVSVALINGLAALRGARLTAAELARAAHHVEYDVLGWQCGVQDQYASAFGGINYISIDEFPRTEVTPLAVQHRIAWELERRLLLIYLGRPHRSTDMHDSVIALLDGQGESAPALVPLRAAAAAMRDAVLSGDFRALGAALIQNTDAQANMHADLVGADARRAIEFARAGGALGWKVNGAGGEGGTLTVLCGDAQDERLRIVEQVTGAIDGACEIPVRLCFAGATIREML